MTSTENDKKSPLPLPNKYKEFYPKNYSKKNPNNKPRHPLEKDSASFYPKSHNNQKARKNSEISDDISEDDYSGLAFKSQNKKEKEKEKNYHTTKKKKNSRLSEDYGNNYKTKWKTEMCHYWEMYGTCKFGDSCAFAHGAEELNQRKMSSNYKTKPCKQFFELGYCSYGIRCQFSHKVLKECPEEDKVSYMKILKEFNNENNLISHEIVHRPRLKTFEDIFKCKEDVKEKNRIKLYEDILDVKKKVKEEPEKAFSEETSDDENKDIKKGENNNFDIDIEKEINEIIDDQDDNNKKRGRFSSI